MSARITKTAVYSTWHFTISGGPEDTVAEISGGQASSPQIRPLIATVTTDQHGTAVKLTATGPRQAGPQHSWEGDSRDPGTTVRDITDRHGLGTEPLVKELIVRAENLASYLEL